jgi:DNA-directed RNA polymerase subunit F
MIKKTEILSLPEVAEYLAEDKEKNAELIAFIKKFNTLKPKEAKELKKKLNELGIIKIREEQASKIIDLVPEDNEDLSKIFIEMDLNEDEKKKILDTIKEFR